MDAALAFAKAAPLVMEVEGLRLSTYADQGGALAVGYGHTVNEYVTITKEQAEKFLHEDMAIALSGIPADVREKLNENQAAALISFVYNVGTGAFQRSTMLKKLKAGDMKGAEAQFVAWVYYTDTKTGHKVLSKGLFRRREAERDLFKCKR
jgi:lysozyme